MSNPTAMAPITPTLTQANVAAMFKLPEGLKQTEAKTYVHSVANSTFIMPTGEVLQFRPAGRVGHYTTTDPYEQAELNAAMRSGGTIRPHTGETVRPLGPKTAAEAARENILAANADRIAAVQAALVALQNGQQVGLPEDAESKVLATQGIVNSMNPITAVPSKAK